MGNYNLGPSLIACLSEEARTCQLLLFGFIHLICLSLHVALNQKEEDVQKLAPFPISGPFIISVSGVPHPSTMK